jgi:hypothetical protein
LGTFKRIAIDVSAAILFLAMFYAGFRILASWEKHYSWMEMDWNKDGSTTISEFFEGSDIERRTVTREGRTCIEYYSVKDGLSKRVDCPRREGLAG